MSTVSTAPALSVDEFNAFYNAGKIRFNAEENDDGAINLFDGEMPIILHFAGVLSLSLGFLAELAGKSDWIQGYIDDMRWYNNQEILSTSVGEKGVDLRVSSHAETEDRWGQVAEEGDYESDVRIPYPGSQMDFDDFLDSNLKYLEEAKEEAEYDLRQNIEESKYFEWLKNDVSYWM